MNGTPTVVLNTFFNHQRQFLCPAVEAVWTAEEGEVLNAVKEQDTPLVVGGDGRSDTPGHSAKYGSYSLMNLDSKKIVSMELVQSTEVKSSVHMEKEGLIRCIDFLKERGFTLDKIITDRHVQIQKWIRENLHDTAHFFDAWHLAKKGQADLIIAKWLSLDNHVHNVHRGHGELFPKCGHGRLGRTKQRRNKWLTAGTKVSTQLTKIITAKRFVKDVGKISCGQQTSGLEAFYSVINHFAPKQFHFSHEGMESR
ncbi:uncharacterized protein LOC135489541 [Lineus longissimus]|uniref:uncharacterized protein LOC135489541 n=1 Tax=Lineus longissimus TaxID=88925 RepID=UPI00315DB15B